MVSIRPAAGPCGSGPGPGWECTGRVSQQKITNTENNFFIVAVVNWCEVIINLGKVINSLRCHLPPHILPYIASILRQVRRLRATSDRRHLAKQTQCPRDARMMHPEQSENSAIPGRSQSTWSLQYLSALSACPLRYVSATNQ